MDGGIVAGLLFFWVICGVIGAIIANVRGGNGAGGFCLGVLFGPIGILIACFIGPSQPVQVAQTPSSAPQKRCPDCAEWVQQEARICRYCRHEFIEPEAPIIEPEQEVEPESISYEEVPYGTSDEPETGLGGWAAVGVIVLIAALVLGGVYLLARPTAPVPGSSYNAAIEASNGLLSNAALPASEGHHRRRHR
jgi:hypothetical protein